jgi:hypothetical protein
MPDYIFQLLHKFYHASGRVVALTNLPPFLLVGAHITLPSPHVWNINTSQQHIDLQFSPDQTKLLGTLQVSVRKQSRAGSALPMRFSLRLLGFTQLLPV